VLGNSRETKQLNGLKFITYSRKTKITEMNKLIAAPVLIGLTIGLVAFRNTETKGVSSYEKNHNVYGSGLTSAATGAPSETNCTQCHGGTAQDGSSENILSVKTAGGNDVLMYDLNTEYDVSLLLSSNPSKKGFQSVVLTSTLDMAGSFTAISGGGAQIKNISNKNYATHSSSSNTLSTTAWKWKWTSPASAVGPVTFYIASNKANGNGQSSGDVIYLSEFIVDGPQSSAAIIEQNTELFTMGYNTKDHAVSMRLNSLSRGNTFFNLVDLTGKSVFTYNLGNAIIGENIHNIQLPADLKDGMYIANLLIHNKAMSAKILVQRQ
jgi:hypothetical protein